jgi:ankyrin repeat protein
MLTLAAADVSTVYRIQQAGRERPEQLRNIMAREEETAVHTAPSLSTLLERAKTGDSALVVQAYLDAGGLATEVVDLRYTNGDVLRVPLLHSMIVRNAHPHRKLAESVGLLVAAGANINAKCSNGYGEDCTALMYALERKCCTRVLAALLQSGADPCMRSLPTGTTALHIAALRGLPESCKLLLTRAGTASEVRDALGRTPLTHAASGGQLNTVQLLLQYSADVNTVDDSNMTPLYLASISDHIDVAACLLTAGADVHAVDLESRCALLAAAQCGSVHVAQLLH